MSLLGDAWRSITGASAPLALPSPERKAEIAAIRHAAAVAVIKSHRGSFLNSAHTAPRPFRGTAETIRALNNSWPLRLVVRSIAERVASTRWFVVMPASGSRRARGMDAFLKYQMASGPTRLGRGKRAEILEKSLHAGDLIQVLDHPLAKLLDRPNTKHNGLVFRKMTVVYLLAVGEWFWVANRGERTGDIKEIELFSPEWATSLPDGPDGFYEFTTQPGSRRRKIPAADVIHGVDPDPQFLYERGSGTAQTLGNEIDMGEAAAITGLAKLENGGVPSAIVSFEDIESQDELDRAEKNLDEKFRGPNNSGRVVVTGSKMEVETLGYSPTDMGLIDTSKFVRDAIVNAFGVPPESVGIVENSNRATAMASETIFARGVLVPILELLRAEINHKLKDRVDPGGNAFVDFESPVPDDIIAEIETMTIQPGALTVNEFRERIGLQPIEEGNVHILPLNVTGVPSESLALDRVGQVADGMSGHLDDDEDDKDKRRRAAWPHDVKEPKQGEQTKQETPRQTADDIIERMQARRLTEPVSDLWDDELKEWMANESDVLGIEPDFAILNPLAAEHIEQLSVSAQHFGGVDSTTRDALRATLVEGFEAGEGPKVIARRIRKSFGIFGKVRAERIARTEVLNSSNFGTWQAHAASGLINERQWVGTGDDRVRDDHSPSVSGSLHGKVVGIKEQFTITRSGSDDVGASAFHPGGFGLGTQDINCRCTTIPVIETPKSGEALTQAYKIFTQRQRRWERRAERAIKRGFRDQLEEVLAAVAAHFRGTL